MTVTEFPSLIEVSVKDFMQRLAAADPAPGGGSAAALAGALAAGLVQMTAAVVLNRQPRGQTSGDMSRARARAAELQARLAGLVDEDAGAYARLIAAYRLPHGSEPERDGRQEAIQGALYGAIVLPLATAESCLEVLRLAHSVAQHTTRLAAPDAAMAALLAHAALAGSARNARANMAGFKDKAMREEASKHAGEIEAEGQAVLTAALAAADGRT
jgi:formiminotetrahydrofolate cyclodeaminase